MCVGADWAGMADVYDWWSRHPRALDVLYAFSFMGRERGLRRRSLEALAPARGERVLEIGSGTGRGFEPLRDAVGPNGSVVGVDASRGMVRSARDRVREAGWGNVHVVRADARRLPVPDGTFDAAYAAMSLSAVPDPAAAIAAARRSLRPGGRLVVLDARPFEGWPWRLANLVIVPLSRRLTDWVPEVDLPAALRREFETVEVTGFNAGTIFVARAERAEAA